ncbi:MAG: hypothetical protein Q9187_008614 [Circinaria calcarea]
MSADLYFDVHQLAKIDDLLLLSIRPPDHATVFNLRALGLNDAKPHVLKAHGFVKARPFRAPYHPDRDVLGIRPRDSPSQKPLSYPSPLVLWKRKPNVILVFPQNLVDCRFPMCPNVGIDLQIPIVVGRVYPEEVDVFHLEHDSLPLEF